METARPTESGLGFSEYVQADNVALVEANIDGHRLKLQLDPPPTSKDGVQQQYTIPHGTAKVSVQALGNRLTIEIEFPQEARLNLARSEPFDPAVAASPASIGGARLPIRQVESLTSTTEVDGNSDDDTSNRSQRGTEPAHDLSPSPRASGAIQPARKSDTPLFERAITKSETSVEPIRYPAQRAGGESPALQFNAVAQSLAADHRAMAAADENEHEHIARHKVGEEFDARIKGRKQEERLNAHAHKHAKHGIDMTQRKSTDSRKKSLQQDEGGEGQEAADVPEMEDGEYTKDEELERLKGFWRKVFHKNGKGSPKSKSAVKKNIKDEKKDEKTKQELAPAKPNDASVHIDAKEKKAEPAKLPPPPVAEKKEEIKEPEPPKVVTPRMEVKEKKHSHKSKHDKHKPKHQQHKQKKHHHHHEQQNFTKETVAEKVVEPGKETVRVTVKEQRVRDEPHNATLA